MSYLRVIDAVLMVLVSNLGHVLRCCAVLLHMFFARVTEELRSYWSALHATQLSHLHDVALHGVHTVLELLGKRERERGGVLNTELV